MPQSNDPSTWLPLVTSVGLFLVTTSISQWIWQHKADDSDDILEYGSKECEDLRRWYHSRRVHDRLSYENINLALEPPQQYQNLPPSSSVVEDRAAVETEWNLHQQQRRPTVAGALDNNGLSRPESVRDMHPNADYDFHPKNRNWRHFEHYNEDDRRRHFEKLAKQVPKIAKEQAVVATQADENKEDDNENKDQDEDENDDSSNYDDTRSILSEGSSSSGEQFVWMKHNRRTQQQRVPSEQTWPEAIKRRLPSGLSNIFENTAQSSPEAEIAAEQHRKQRASTGTSRSFSSVVSEDPTEVATGGGHPTRRRSLFSSNLLAPFRLVQRMLSFGVCTNVNGDDDEAPPILNNRILRRQYNARIMPEKVIMVRHGQSMGNINEVLYSTTPDNAMPLTDLGWEQARAAGEILKNRIVKSGETLHFIVSPYVRTVETFHGIVSAWCDPKEFAHIEDKESRIKAWYGRLMEMGLTWNEDSRIREQDFGNYQDPEAIKSAKQERHRFGIFYYRFPHGESASDVFDRVSTFLDSLWRSFEMNRSRNYVLVTHGISIRVLLARYFRYTIDQFNILANPRNCEMIVLGHNGEGRLEFEGRCALDVAESSETGQKQVTGFKFHKRLRILPRNTIRKVKIRISPDDN